MKHFFQFIHKQNIKQGFIPSTMSKWFFLNCLSFWQYCDIIMERMLLASLLIKYMLPNQVKLKPLETVQEAKILESMDSCSESVSVFHQFSSCQMSLWFQQSLKVMRLARLIPLEILITMSTSQIPNLRYRLFEFFLFNPVLKRTLIKSNELINKFNVVNKSKEQTTNSIRTKQNQDHMYNVKTINLN